MYGITIRLSGLQPHRYYAWLLKYIGSLLPARLCLLLATADKPAEPGKSENVFSFHTLTEHQLFTAITAGDARAFDEFYRRTSRAMYAHCIKHVKSKLVAEELLQDTYVQLWKSRHLLKEIDQPVSYVFKIVSRAIHKYLTNRQHRRQVLDINDQTNVLQTIENEAPYNRVNTKIAMQHIEKAILQLPPQQQAVFRLSKLEGYSYKETAAVLGISVSAVGAYLAEAQRKIRAALWEE
jgi:RNA polymerase sigma-70 factor (ECF subfamily)